jgi:hypothetical protein
VKPCPFSSQKARAPKGPRLDKILRRKEALRQNLGVGFRVCLVLGADYQVDIPSRDSLLDANVESCSTWTFGKTL